MADIENVKQGLRCCTGLGCHHGCKYHEEPLECGVRLRKDALSVIEELQEEIERLKAQKQKWLQNIADQQLAVSPTGYETDIEELAKRTGEWNGLQMAWEILTKE